MIKYMFALKRKPGLSLEEFKDYYENHHAPLVARNSRIVGYRRNYIIPGGYTAPHVDHQIEEPEYDVISEMWFEDLDALREAEKNLEGEFGRLLREDELKVFDMTPGALRAFLVEEFVSTDEELAMKA